MIAGTDLRGLLRFCVVGGIGFLTDAGVLYLMTGLLGAGPMTGRAVSFPVAVVTTWLLNRTWTFRAAKRPSVREFLSYLSVQGVGLACNLVVYTGLVALAPVPFALPLPAVAVASAVAMAVNYAGMNRFVFQARK